MAAYTIRAQLIKPDETADVKKAIELLQSRIGVELSHTQIVVALARQYLKNNA